MKKVIVSLFVFCSFGATAQSYNKTDVSNYIRTYSNLAITKMQEHKIPASITLAQGILESAAGTSELAVKANNHFGIKCHKTWEGKTYHKDDDKQGECFRKYNSAAESFEDHSQFLKASRYADLFKLEITDYKSWAHGLKKAGYATHPEYAQRLIRVIEDYDLAIYDQKDISQQLLANNNNRRNEHQQNKPFSKPNVKPVEEFKTEHENFNEFSPVYYPYTLRAVYSNNGSYFIVAKKGDTFYQIALDVQLTVGELKFYNDISTKNYEPQEGEMIYLQRKKPYAEVNYHTLKSGETLRSVAQKYGCRLKTIYKLNKLNKTEIVIEDGLRLKLRK